MAGKPWYNNGIIEIQKGANEVIPDGFIRGRLPVSDTTREKIRNIQLNRSQEYKDEINKKRSDALKSTFATKSDEEKLLTIERRKQTMNNKSDEEKAIYRQHLSDGSKGKNKGTPSWLKGLTKDTDERVKKLADSTRQGMLKYIEKVKSEDPDFYVRWRNQVSSTMKANNSYGTSQPEEDYYRELLTKYDKTDIIRQYHEKRYPFDCDFYIIPEDKFIEINKHWTHGGHPFDETNLNDICTLEEWQEKAKTSNFYKIAIYVWTDLDVRKQKTAKENNLNYVTIY